MNPDKSVTLMQRGSDLLPRACDNSKASVANFLKGNKVHVMYNKESKTIGKVLSFFNMSSCLPCLLF